MSGLTLPRINQLLFLVFLLSSSLASAAEYEDRVERDFQLRSLKPLHVTNLRGGVVIHGWALDKIRITARRRVSADSPEAASSLFSALDFRFQTFDDRIELSASYGRGLDIRQRLQERENPKSAMEIVVFAPAKLPLNVWAHHGLVKISGWKASVDVRTSEGEVVVENSIAESFAVLCPSCRVSVDKLSGDSLRCIGGSESVEVSNYSGKQVFVETAEGQQNMHKVDAEQLYISKSGPIIGRDLRGRVEFQTQTGPVRISDLAGFISGYSRAGPISIRVRDWKFMDRALIESWTGSIELALPQFFSGDVDLWSVSNQTTSAFLIRPSSESAGVYGPDPANRLRGIVGEGGEQLKLFSLGGKVSLLRGDR